MITPADEGMDAAKTENREYALFYDLEQQATHVADQLANLNVTYTDNHPVEVSAVLRNIESLVGELLADLRSRRNYVDTEIAPQWVDGLPGT